jgi:hypothetical protein
VDGWAIGRGRMDVGRWAWADGRGRMGARQIRDAHAIHRAVLPRLWHTAASHTLLPPPSFSPWQGRLSQGRLSTSAFSHPPPAERLTSCSRTSGSSTTSLVSRVTRTHQSGASCLRRAPSRCFARFPLPRAAPMESFVGCRNTSPSHSSVAWWREDTRNSSTTAW